MIPGTMTVWFVVAVPVLIMFFALAMERLEERLRHLTLHQNEVEEFLRAAGPDEVQALFGSGIGRALELFRRRRRPKGRRPRVGAAHTGTSPNGASPIDTGPIDTGLVTSRSSQQQS
jgi:hypothetical protein